VNAFVAKLDLSYNSFTDKGVESIAPFVEASPSLTELNLSNNDGLGDLGLQVRVEEGGRRVINLY
jgi:hypothetical protein